MILLVITTGSFPSGEAASNRSVSYLKGLVELGIKVKVILLQPDKKQSIKNTIKKGEFYGIQYEYANCQSNLNISKINKIFNRIKSHRIAFNRAKSLIKIKKNKVKILLLVTKPYDILPYMLLSKLYRISVFHERTEYPFLNTRNALQKVSLWFYLKFLIPRFDGIFVITQALVAYFSKYTGNKTRIIHIPMTVEVERFSENNERINEFGEYIAYCGSMYTDKDGVPDLIQAFSVLGKSEIRINLLLIGDNSDKRKFELIQNCINSSPFKDRIFCIGRVERDDMPKYLNNAKILALARPDNIQAKGGFPTKLGEYLSTGKPVVVTKVGEIPNYLRDKENAFLSEPDNPNNFAQKMMEVLSDYDQALMIGQKGKEVALSTFSYKVQAVTLLQFIKKTPYYCE